MRSPASPDALAEKMPDSYRLDDYLYFYQHTPDVGHNLDPLLECLVDNNGLLSCKDRQDMVFRNCGVNTSNFVFFGPQNAQGGACPEIVFNAVPI